MIKALAGRRPLLAPVRQGGAAIVNLLALQPGEHIQAIIDTRDYETNPYLFFATKKGTVKKTALTAYGHPKKRIGIIAK
mgnify:CR=1 FL=1